MPRYVRTQTLRKRLLLAMALLPAFLLPAPTRAGDKKIDSSLDLIPADATFYSAMLRTREQVETIANSKTWTRLTQLPYYQMGMALLKQQYEQSDNFAEFRQWIAQDENRDLVEMLTDAVSTEIFCYGASNFIDFIDLIQEMNSSRIAGRLGQLVEGIQREDKKATLREVLRALGENTKKIKFPDLIIGFKIRDTAKAEAQIKRLEMLGQVLAGLQPMFKGRIKRVEVGGSSLLSLSLDGGMVPWDQINWQELEEKPGEFEDLRESLKKIKLTITLGVHRGFLLLAIGSTTQGVARLCGDGPRLSGRPELKPVLQAAGKRLTGIGYSSKALAAQFALKAEDIDTLATQAGQALEAIGLPEQRRNAIGKDLIALAGDIKKNLTPPGASLSFSYLTPRGYEDFEYQYGEFPDRNSSQSLSLLDHVGGDPILAVVGRSRGTLQSYRTFSKWLKIIYGHAESLVLENLGDAQKQAYDEVGKLIFPLLKRFDATTAKMLLPSLADGQAGFVLDAKWKSKQWHPALPTLGKEMPMPELAFLVGVSDSALLEKAMKSYGKLIEDALTLAKENAPPDAQPPFTKLPKPKVRTAATGKLFLWHLPEEWMLDRRVALTAGLSDKVGVLAFSAKHAERLLASTPLKIEGGPLAEHKGALTGASYFNWPHFLDAITSWPLLALDKAPLEQLLPGGGENKDEATVKKQRKEIARHVRTVLGALKAIRLTTSATYVQDGALITHSEVVIRDE